MILSFKCGDTQALFETGKSRRFANIKDVAERKLTQFCPRPLRRLRTRLPGRLLVQRQGCLPLMQHPAHG